MIIDLILDRRDNIRDGYGDSYDAREFYTDCREYAQCYEDDTQWKIVQALDLGTNENVQDMLCTYVDEGIYYPQIKEFIRSMDWLGDYNND